MKTNKTKQKSQNSNQMSSGNAPTKLGRRKMKNGVPQNKGITPLPPIYRAVGDVTSLRLRTSANFNNTAAGVCSKIIVFTPRTIATPDYYGLGDLFPLLSGMSLQYSRFMVGRVVAQLVPFTPTTAGGYVAFNYEADDANTSGPPTNLVDVSSALHSDIAQVTEIAGISCNASDYFNDWRQTAVVSGASSTLSQAGVMQLYGSNAAILGASVFILQLEIDIHLCGFRF